MQTLLRSWVFPTGVAMALGLAPTGCATQAQSVPDGHGGYVLRTTADSLDQAMKRFEEKAPKLCPGGSYEMGEPRVVGSTPPLDIAIDVDCTGP